MPTGTFTVIDRTYGMLGMRYLITVKSRTPNKYKAPHMGKKEELKMNNISGKFRTPMKVAQP